MNHNIPSIKDRLKNYSKRHNKTHQFTLIRYFQERLLYRLSISKYKRQFLLKGGALVYALYQEASRPTLDIDLLVRQMKADQETIKKVFQEICRIPFDDGVTFNANELVASEITKEGNYNGIRVKVPTQLGNIKQMMQVDIGFGDVVTPGEVQMDYPTLINMEAPQLLAYSTESLVSEKFQAMIDLGEYNSRMKDFYDVYKILQSKEYSNAHLRNAIKNTFEKRNTGFEENHFLFEAAFYEDEKRATQWNAFLKKSKLDVELTFQEVMQTIKNTLEPIYESLR